MNTILHAVTFAVVVPFSFFLLALGGASLFAPARAKTFLLGFATSAFTHYLEMVLRLAVGGSILWQAPHLMYPAAFAIFGWMMVGTTALLLLLPWKWHRRLARKAVPQAIGYLPFVGVVSIVLGIVLSVFLLKSLTDR